MRLAFSALLMLPSLFLLPAAHAAEGDALDMLVSYPYYHTTIVLDGEGRATETREWSRVVLKEAALSSSKTASVSFSTSAETGEVLAAYTLKPDGRRIEVSKDSYQVVTNSGRGKDSPLYSDRTTISVVFPELAVGDTAVFANKVVDSEPLFPGKYSTVETFDTQSAYGEVSAIIDYPEALSAQFDTFGMTQTANAASTAGRKRIEWRWQNPKPVQSDRRDYSVIDLDHQVHYAFSTFGSYAEIAQAYGARAKPKAAVTKPIKELAAEIVGKVATPRDEAKALYEWVATNISYAGNCIGIGAVVPRDLPLVIDNRIGDCKDHATLLQALLAARGIESSQALINAGSNYTLPKVPVVSAMNHVINYLPSMKLFLDSTSNQTAFGHLPEGDIGKPVLLVDGFDASSRTPVPGPESNSETSNTRYAVAADGSVRGATDATLQGNAATQLRIAARQMTRNLEDDLVRNMFRAQNLNGSGRFIKDDPSGFDDRYHYRVEYQVEKLFRLPGAGAFYVNPIISNGSVASKLQFTRETERDASVRCQGGSGSDVYELEFPGGLQVLSVPDDVNIQSPYLDYRARYQLKGRVLKIERRITDKTAQATCSPEMTAAYRKYGDQVLEDLRSQVLYKLKKPASRR